MTIALQKVWFRSSKPYVSPAKRIPIALPNHTIFFLLTDLLLLKRRKSFLNNQSKWKPIALYTKEQRAFVVM